MRGLFDRFKRAARRIVHGRVQRAVDRVAGSVGVGIERRPGGAHDAFTHAYVSARLTRWLGPRIALRMGEWNERLGSDADGKHLEAAMDRHNNEVGRSVARELRRCGRTSGPDAARAIREALDRGHLRVIEAGALVPSGRQFR